ISSRAHQPPTCATTKAGYKNKVATKAWIPAAPAASDVGAPGKIGEPSGDRTQDPLIKSPIRTRFADRSSSHSVSLHRSYLGARTRDSPHLPLCSVKTT